MAMQLLEFLHFIREHPIASCFLLLFLTTPLFRIVVFFSPLLISTALCVVALISVGPHIAATEEEVEREANWVKLGSCEVTPKEIGWNSVRERANKKLRATKEEITWLEWMKGLDGSGRAWLESRLREEGLLSKPANRETILALIEDAKSLLAASKNPRDDGESSDQKVGIQNVSQNIPVDSSLSLAPTIMKEGAHYMMSDLEDAPEQDSSKAGSHVVCQPAEPCTMRLLANQNAPGTRIDAFNEMPELSDMNVPSPKHDIDELPKATQECGISLLQQPKELQESDQDPLQENVLAAAEGSEVMKIDESVSSKDEGGKKRDFVTKKSEGQWEKSDAKCAEVLKDGSLVTSDDDELTNPYSDQYGGGVLEKNETQRKQKELSWTKSEAPALLEDELLNPFSDIYNLPASSIKRSEASTKRSSKFPGSIYQKQLFARKG